MSDNTVTINTVMCREKSIQDQDQDQDQDQNLLHQSLLTPTIF
jgi:hypothetical protein